MARAVLVLVNDMIRAKAARWAIHMPLGTRVEYKAPQRTLPQNARFWAMLTDIATQKEHFGRKYVADDWKVIFLHALGREARFVPALDGDGFIPIGQSSSDLSIPEMSDMIECMYSWGAQNGVVFNEKESAA